MTGVHILPAAHLALLYPAPAHPNASPRPLCESAYRARPAAAEIAGLAAAVTGGQK